MNITDPASAHEALRLIANNRAASVALANLRPLTTLEDIEMYGKELVSTILSFGMALALRKPEWAEAVIRLAVPGWDEGAGQYGAELAVASFPVKPAAEVE